LLSKSVENVKAVGCLLLHPGLRAAFRFFDRDIIFIRKPLQRFHIRILLMLHQKTDSIPTSSAAKTFKDLLGWGNRERRRFFIVKRTKAKIVGSPFFEFYKSADNFSNVNAAENLLYRLRRDQKFQFERRI
jgi:hypothetical protein